MVKGKLKILFNVLLIFIFFLMIWLPNIDSIFNISPNYSNQEKRSLAQLPKLEMNRKSIVKFHGQFVKYFIDNFGFRTLLIRWNSLLKLKLFHIDQFPKVLVGKNNWLYLIKHDDRLNTLDYYRSIQLFDKKSLKEWISPLEEIQSRLKKQGIKFVLVLAPIKHKIYPEYIPEYLRVVRKESRLDQLKEYLDKHSNIHYIDLTDVVRKEKENHLVYFKHDVHWNFYGSFAGYRKIIRELSIYFPNMNPRSIDEYDISEIDLTGGDLAQLLCLNDFFKEKWTIAKPRFTLNAKKIDHGYTVPRKISRFTEVFENKTRMPFRAVVFHDSFFNFLKSPFIEHFGRTACFQSYDRFDFSLIDREKPDIVIYEMVENHLLRSPVYVTVINAQK